MFRRNNNGFGQDVGEADCIRETYKAILVVWNGKRVWVPKSQLHDDSEVRRVGDSGVLIVSDWFGGKLLEERDNQCQLNLTGE